MPDHESARRFGCLRVRRYGTVRRWPGGIGSSSTRRFRIIGVYIAPDPGAENEDAKNGIYPFPVAQFFEKALMLGTGQAPVKRYNEYLRGLIGHGRAKPSKIVSHHIRIDEVPEAYEKFDKRIDGHTKVLIRFADEKKAA